MLNLVLGDPQYGQYDFGETITLRIYQQDKATPQNLSTFTGGVVQTFKRYGDDNFLPFKDVARAIRLTGQMALVIEDIPIIFDADQGANPGVATFEWTETKRPSLFGRFWIKVVLTSGTVKVQSTRFVSVYVHPGAPQ